MKPQNIERNNKIYLLKFGGLSDIEVSYALNITVGTVKSVMIVFNQKYDLLYSAIEKNQDLERFKKAHYMSDELFKLLYAKFIKENMFNIIEQRKTELKIEKMKINFLQSIKTVYRLDDNNKIINTFSYKSRLPAAEIMPAIFKMDKINNQIASTYYIENGTI